MLKLDSQGPVTKPGGPLAYLRTLLPEDQFAKGVAVLAGGTAIGQGIVILLSPVVSRLYKPDDFGVLAVYAAMLGILGVAAALRYEIAIPLPQEHDTAINLLVLALLSALATSMACAVALWLWPEALTAWTNTPAFRPYLWLVPLGMLCAAFYSIFNYWAVREKKFRLIAGTKVTQGAAMSAVQIGGAFVSGGPLGLLLGQLLGQTAGFFSLARGMLRANYGALGRISYSTLLTAGVRYRRFPLFSGGSSLLDAAGQHLPALFMAALFGPTVAGCFALAQRVVGVPLGLLGQAVSQVYFAEAAQLASRCPSEIKKLYLRNALKLLKLGVLPLALLALAGPWLFSLVFGGAWLEAGRFAQILAPMLLAQFVVNPLSQTLNVLERQDLQLWWTVLWLVLTVGTFAIVWAWKLSPAVTIACYGGSLLISYVAHFYLCIYATTGLEKQRGKD